MGWRNPPIPWSELERRLSGRSPRPVGDEGLPEGANGGDSPAWSRKRPTYEPPSGLLAGQGSVPYAELHCHSNFSFLDGASHPEELAEEAARLGLEALAVTDHDGFYGVVRFAEAARAVGLPTVFGVELTLDGPSEPQNGVADPAGRHLVVLARQPAGYARLARAVSKAQMAGQKGAPHIGLADLADLAGGEWMVLTGCRKGTVPAALEQAGPAAAERALDELVAAFGRDHVVVELWDHGDPLDTARNDALSRLALRRDVWLVATGNVHYATPQRRRLATAMAAVRARRSLDDADGWLPAGAGAHLRSGSEQARRFARFPGVVEAAAELGRECAFDLSLVAPNLPPYPCPDGLDEMAFLRRITEQGASRPERYGPRPPSVRSTDARPGEVGWVGDAMGADSQPASGGGSNERAWGQIDHELDVIEALGFPGYFLIVWDIVQFCERADIFCQGRGSAANSAVCFALGVTKADAVRLGLLFERFLSPERDGPPDIDLDIESGRREEVIQYVYERYGRENAAQVANVITYRGRSAVRDMAKALGASTGQQDAWSKQLDPWGGISRTIADGSHEIPMEVMELAAEIEHFPRHLGIHSGGMVLCDRPVVEVCPVEWGRMADRSVLQWDKDDCAAVGLVKFDLLGLGMLTALHHAVDLIREHRGVEVDLATIPQEPEVYDMLCAADSIGVFQVESRAQMATLPRLRPREFYDLVVEVALIRPGPIQGGSVHPYIRRRNGKEPVTFLHPLLEPSLGKTLGVPLFQEQLMQMAIDVAGFTAGEADQLRQAMGSKRSAERMERLKARLFDGMAERGITGDVAEQIYEKLAAFANFGFPESHSVSFAYLVYSSAWIKLHEPAAFCAALLNAQPMGFYSPHSLVQDARRHGVVIRTPDINASGAGATLEPCEESEGGLAVRLGVGSVRTIGDELAERIDAGRPYTDMEDVARRNALTLVQLEALATAGCFSSFGSAPEISLDGAGFRDTDVRDSGPNVSRNAMAVDGPGFRDTDVRDSGRNVSRNAMGDSGTGAGAGRREAIWAAGAVAQSKPDRLAGIVTGAEAPALPGMDDREAALADLWATGVSPEGHPTRFVRDELDRLGVITVAGLQAAEDGRTVLIGGVVTHRQRPATASGITFLNIEDETGLVNVVVSRGCWMRHRRVARTSPALLIRGKLEKVEGVINVVAERISLLPLPSRLRSRDFH